MLINVCIAIELPELTCIVSRTMKEDLRSNINPVGNSKNLMLHSALCSPSSSPTPEIGSSPHNKQCPYCDKICLLTCLDEISNPAVWSRSEMFKY